MGATQVHPEASVLDEPSLSCAHRSWIAMRLAGFSTLIFWPWMIIPWHHLQCYYNWQSVDETEVGEPTTTHWAWVAIANQVLLLAVVPLSGAYSQEMIFALSKFVAMCLTEGLGWCIFFVTIGYWQQAFDNPDSPVAQCLSSPGMGFVGFWALLESTLLIIALPRLFFGLFPCQGGGTGGVEESYC